MAHQCLDTAVRSALGEVQRLGAVGEERCIPLAEVQTPGVELQYVFGELVLGTSLRLRTFDRPAAHAGRVPLDEDQRGERLPV